jgi:hypothetical protein
MKAKTLMKLSQCLSFYPVGNENVWVSHILGRSRFLLSPKVLSFLNTFSKPRKIDNIRKRKEKEWLELFRANQIIM